MRNGDAWAPLTANVLVQEEVRGRTIPHGVLPRLCALREGGGLIKYTESTVGIS